MKKLLSALIITVLLLTLVACGGKGVTPTPTKAPETKPETITMQVFNGNGELIDAEMPSDPQRVVCLNYISVDMMFALGLEDKIVGSVQESAPQAIKEVLKDKNIPNLGGLKSYDIEKIMELEPDLILSSDRSRSAYETLSQIAPTYSVSLAYADGWMDSFTKLVDNHCEIFGLGDEGTAIVKKYNERIESIKTAGNGGTAALILFTGEQAKTLGDEGRCSIITNEMGFKNVSAEIDVNHGNDSSFETILSLNPEYIFVLDKDTAVGTEATLATELMNNKIIKMTNAYINDKIIYLNPGDTWYLCDGGITAMDLIISNIEESLGLK